ncbi:hypothetical protein OR263_10525 [Streptomyces sp. NEAU-H22]|uniref:hypothetical protein n=1 Tax=unclassified Streptomyces TaxID=2593676 RepID=UPI0022567875|nr:MULTISPECIES: hypothetical protein [unclassified Streptomyces]MCX3287140.1 hypothetical protein [Streptomyces sp. NEAU-H22]WMD03065.1 hypothetical protein Q7C01_01120 [Streptomyces sp. FXY-T5]
MTAMDIALTIAALLVLVAAGAYVLHRHDSAHSERITSRSFSRFLPGPPAADRAAGTTPPPPPHSTASATVERRRPRRHREPTAHNKQHAVGD